VRHGNAVAQTVEVDRYGFPTDTVWLDTKGMSVERRKGTPNVYSIGGQRLSRDGLYHARGFFPAGTDVGLSPEVLFKESLRTGLAVNDYVRQFFTDGAHPNAVLESDQHVLTQMQAEEIRDRVYASTRRRRPMVMGKGWKFTPWGSNPKDADASATQTFVIAQAARILGLQPQELGASAVGTGSVTYTNAELDGLRLLRFPVGWWLTNFQQLFTQMVPRGQYVRILPDSLLRMDTKTRYEAHALAIDGGWSGRSEIRKLEEKGPLPVGVPEFGPLPQIKAQGG
jgi:HK97 family phage portal protein